MPLPCVEAFYQPHSVCHFTSASELEAAGLTRVCDNLDALAVLISTLDFKHRDSRWQNDQAASVAGD